MISSHNAGLLTLRTAAVLAVFGLWQTNAKAQAPGATPQNHANVVPFSGRESGNVSAQQSAGQGGASGVDTIQSSVNTSGRYSGSTPDATSANGEIQLSFEDAIQRGLRFNLSGTTATNSEAAAKAQRLSAISAFLPNVNGLLSESVSQSYLPAEGITGSALGLGPSGQIPVVTGQYHYYTAQATLSQNAFDLTAFHNLQGAKALEAASHLSARDARELVVLAVGGTYLQSLAAAAVVESQRQQVALAEASYKQAAAQQTAGTRARIDANRSLVELKTEQQRLTSDEAELAKQNIRLGRLIGIAPGARIILTGTLPETVPPAGTEDEEIARGEAQRFDLKAAAEQLKAAEQSAKAARSEYLPTGAINGGYGMQGSSFDVGRVSYSGVASLNIPLFQSGRVRADTRQADATLSQRKAEFADQRLSVETDIRTAMIDLGVAQQQTIVAKENQALAHDTLTQSQDRFAAGVTDTVEVVQAQESLSAADRDYINSLYSQSLARLRLAQATGVAEQEFHTLLGGQK
jgi:outer membrane protein TolC